jgi:DNA-binding beta-propeller fold protein YncE
VDTATTTVIDTIAVGNGPNGSVVSPDGARVYVANGIDGTVSVISV